MKKIRRIYNWLVAHVAIDWPLYLCRFFNWLSNCMYDLSEQAYKLFWNPVD
jgi:hypothetical protein